MLNLRNIREDGKFDNINYIVIYNLVFITKNVRKAHSFRGGMDSTLFYNLMCMLLLILHTYYSIIYVWKIIIDIQTQQYL